jgi:hypothetical protein
MAIAGATAMTLLAAGMVLGRLGTGGSRFGWAGCLSIATLITIVALRRCLWLESRVIEYDAVTTLIVSGIVVAAAALVSRLIATPGQSRA